MKKFFIVSIVSLVIGFALGVIAGRQMIADDHLYTKEHSDTIIYIDTITFLKPVPVDSVVISRKIIADTVHVTINNQDTAIVVEYDIPITQKEYNDTSYHAWVSGYEPSLDSIYVFPKYHYITTTVSKEVYKTKRFGFGINSGVGYSGNGFSPYIGIGVQYNIFQW